MTTTADAITTLQFYPKRSACVDISPCGTSPFYSLSGTSSAICFSASSSHTSNRSSG